MKNKHLVLLFLLTLAVGLAVRRAPWKNATIFQTSLLKIDTAEIQQIQISLPGKPTLFLLRGDLGWSAEQSDRSVKVSSEAVQEMLLALADLQSVRIVHTKRPDSLGFVPSAGIQLEVIHSNAQQESLTLGWETTENNQAATFVQLPKHEGIYLANKHLRNFFTKSLRDFRQQTFAQFRPEAVQRFRVFGPKVDSVIFQKNDSSGIWTSPVNAKTLSGAVVQGWLLKIKQLEGLAFADLFDESHAKETHYAQIQLEFQDQTQPLFLNIFRPQQVNIPEELPVHKPDRRQLSPYVVHSSQNPTNYFALPDTMILRQICRPF